MAGQEIEFKGMTFTLSVVNLGEQSLEALRATLMDKVTKAPQFFNCAPVVINISQVEGDFDFDALREVVESQDFVLVGVTGCKDEALKTAARGAGLAVMTSGGASQNKVSPPPKSVEPAPAPEPVVIKEAVPSKVVQGQIRSGQQVYAQDCDLVVLGSVGNGAEVIADGNIHIYGTLRGRAIAGAKGNKQSRIFCHNLQAELVSIAGVYMLYEQLSDQTDKAACVYIQDQQMQFSALI